MSRPLIGRYQGGGVQLWWFDTAMTIILDGSTVTGFIVFSIRISSYRLSAQAEILRYLLPYKMILFQN